MATRHLKLHILRDSRHSAYHNLETNALNTGISSSNIPTYTHRVAGIALYESGLIMAHEKKI